MVDNIQTPPLKGIAEGLIDLHPSLTQVVLPNDFESRIGVLLDSPMPSPIALPKLSSPVEYSTPFSTGSKIQGLFQSSQEELKRDNPSYNSPLGAVHSYNLSEVEPYLTHNSNYDSNISAAFGQAGKGALIGATLASETGPGALLAAGIGGSLGFISGMFGVSGRQGFIPGTDNRNRTAKLQSGVFNRLTGFTNNIIDRAFEAGVGGTAALLTTPYGAITGKDFYDWGSNPLTSHLTENLEQSEYKAKLSDAYLDKGPIAKFFTGEGFQNEIADMAGFTLGMMTGFKGGAFLNKGAGTLGSMLGDAASTSITARNGKLIGDLLPTLAKQSSKLFTKGVQLERAGIASTETTFSRSGTEAVKDILRGKGKNVFDDYYKNLRNSIKEGSFGLSALSSFERTTLASYGEGRIESAQSYKDIYQTAIDNGYSPSDAAQMATSGANKTLFGNLAILGITNQFGLNQLMKPKGLANLSKWFTKEWAFDNSTKTLFKNILKTSGGNALKGAGIEGFAEELGQFAISDGAKRYELNNANINNPVHASFMTEIINAYKEGLSSDEGISNWFGGALFGAIMGSLGMEGASGVFLERGQAKKIEIPSSIKTKVTKMTEAMEFLATHTSPFNGQLFTSYSPVEGKENEFAPDPNGTIRMMDDPMRIVQLAKALMHINSIASDQAMLILKDVETAKASEDPNIQKGLVLISEYLNSIENKEQGVKSLEDYINSNLTSQEKQNVLFTLSELHSQGENFREDNLKEIYANVTKSNYVFDYISNGLEDKLFTELDMLEESLSNPQSESAQKDAIEFFGKLYKSTEIEQAKQDISKFRESLKKQTQLYKSLYNRYGEPLTHIKITKDGKTLIHPITVNLKEVFRSSLVQQELEDALVILKNKIETAKNDLLAQPGFKEEYFNVDKTSEDVLNSSDYRKHSSNPVFKDLQVLETFDKFYVKDLEKENKKFKLLTDKEELIKQALKVEKILKQEIENPTTEKPKPVEVKNPEVEVPVEKPPVAEEETPPTPPPASEEETPPSPAPRPPKPPTPPPTPPASSSTSTEEEEADLQTTLEGEFGHIEEEEEPVTEKEKQDFNDEAAKPRFSSATINKSYGNSLIDNIHPTQTFKFNKFLSEHYVPGTKVSVIKLNSPLAKLIIENNQLDKEYYSKHPKEVDEKGALLYVLVDIENNYIDQNGNSLGVKVGEDASSIADKLVYSKNSVRAYVNRPDNKIIKNRFSHVDEFSEEEINEIVDNYIQEQYDIYDNKLKDDNPYVLSIQSITPGILYSNIKGVASEKKNMKQYLANELESSDSKIVVNTGRMSGLRSGQAGLQVGTGEFANIFPISSTQLSKEDADVLASILITIYYTDTVNLDKEEGYWNEGADFNTKMKFVNSLINFVYTPKSTNAFHSNGVFRYFDGNDAVYSYGFEDKEKTKRKEIFRLKNLKNNPNLYNHQEFANFSKALQEHVYYSVNNIQLENTSNNFIKIKYNSKATSPEEMFSSEDAGMNYADYLKQSDMFTVKTPVTDIGIKKINKQIILEKTSYVSNIVPASEVAPSSEAPANSDELSLKEKEDFDNLIGADNFRQVFETQEEKEDFEFFTTWLSQVLPQFSIEMRSSPINGINQGQMYKNLIRLWEGASKGTGFHEAFEAVFFNMLSSSEQEQLLSEFKQRPGYFEYYSTKERIHHSQATDAQAKEMLAEGFIDFMNTKKLTPNSPKSNNFFLSLWDAILKLINSIKSFFSSVEEANNFVNDVYTKIALGEYKDFKIENYYDIPQNREILRTPKNKVVNEAELQTLKNVIQDRVVIGYFGKLNYNIYQILDETQRFNQDFLNYVDKIVDEVIVDYNYPISAEKRKNAISKGFKFDLADENGEFIPYYKTMIRDLFIEDFQKASYIDKFDDFDVEEHDKDPLGIKPANEINPTSNVNNVARLFLSTLYNVDNTNNLIPIYALDKLEHYSRPKLETTLAILLNKLTNLEPYFSEKENRMISLFEVMMKELDKTLLDNPSYLWINDLKYKLKVHLSQDSLSEYEKRLQMAFVNSFHTYTYTPNSLVTSNDLGVYFTSPAYDANLNNTLVTWIANLKELAKLGHKIVKVSAEDNSPYIDLDELTRLYPIYSPDVLQVFGIKDFNDIKNIPEVKPIVDRILNLAKNYNKQRTFKLSEFFEKFIPSSIRELADISINSAKDKVNVFVNSKGTNQYTIVTPSFSSRLLNTIKIVSTRSELFKSIPELNTIGLRRNFLLKPGGYFFNEDGTKKKVSFSLGIFTGIEDKINKVGSDYSNLSEVDKYAIKVNGVIGSMFTMPINSDKGLENTIKLNDPYVSFQNSSNMDFVVSRMKSQLIDELEFVITHKDASIAGFNPERLGFYKDIINFTPQDLEDLSTNKISIDEYVSSKSKLLYDHINMLIKQELADMYANRIVDLVGDNQVAINKLNVLTINALIRQNFGTDNVIDKDELDNEFYIDKSMFEKIMTYAIVNNMLFDKDLFNLMYINSALFAEGELAKRASASASMKQPVDSSIETRNSMNKMHTRLDGKIRDGFYNILAYNDPKVASAMFSTIAENWYEVLIASMPKKEVEEKIGASFTEDGKFIDLLDIKDSYIDTFMNLKESDGQAFMMLDGWFDLMYASSKLTTAQINLYKYEKAFERLDRAGKLGNKYSKEESYTYTNTNLLKQDNDIYKKGKPYAVHQVIKPHGSGLVSNGDLTLHKILKNSVMPLSWTRVKDNTLLRSKYIQWQKNKGDIITFNSGIKLGQELDANKQSTPLYNNEGVTNVLPPVQKIKIEDFTLQVETSASLKNSVTRGVQITKIITVNLKEFTDKDSVKYNPRIDKLVKDYVENINEIEKRGLERVIKRLGLKQDEEGTYYTDNVFELTKNLRYQAELLDLPISVTELFIPNVDGTLPYYFDSSAERKRIEYVLNSILDSELIHQKHKGKMSPQVSSVFERKDVSWIYKKETKKGIVWSSTKNYASLSEEERKSAKISSSDLKLRKDGAIEVKLPSYLKGIIDIKDPKITDDRLLKLIGYRIPTQSLGQVENIIVVGFLDESYGDMIMVPSEIVGKAGSDFDIDKLNIYIPHFYMTKSGEYKYVEYNESTDEKDIQERYKQYVTSKEHEYYKEQLKNIFDAINVEYQDRGLGDDVNRVDIVMDSETFFKLPLDIQNDYKEFNRKLNEKYLNYTPLGAVKSMEFRQYTLELIDIFNSLEEGSGIQFNGVVYGKEHVITLKKLVKEYDDILQQYGANKSSYEVFIKNLEEFRKYKQELLSMIPMLPIAVSKERNLMTYDQFASLPIKEQQSKEALENRNIELMRDIISLKENKLQHLLPNSSASLKAISEKILPKTKTPSYSITTLHGYAKKRHNLIYAKNLVGAGAQNITSQAIAQLGGITLNRKSINLLFDAYLTDSGNYSMYQIYDKKNNLISATLSEYLSAFVDAAKDEFIIESNVNFDTVGTIMLLARLGIPAQTAIFFVNQPVIKEYVRQKQINDSMLNINNMSNAKFQRNFFGLLIQFILNNNLYSTLETSIFEDQELVLHTRQGDIGHEQLKYEFELAKNAISFLNDDGKTYSVVDDIPDKPYKDIIRIIKLAIHQKLDLKDKLKSEEAMLDNIKKGFVSTMDPLLALVYYTHFIETEEIGSKLTGVNSRLNIDSKKTRTSYENSLLLDKENTEDDTFLNVYNGIYNSNLNQIRRNRTQFSDLLEPFLIMSQENNQEHMLEIISMLNEMRISDKSRINILDRYTNFYLTYLIQYAGDFKNKFNLIGQMTEENIVIKLNSIRSSIEKGVYNGVAISDYNKKLLRQEVLPVLSQFIFNENPDDIRTTLLIPFNNKISTSDKNTHLLKFEKLLNTLDSIKANNASFSFYMEIKETLESLTDYSILQSGVQNNRFNISSLIAPTLYIKRVNELLTKALASDPNDLEHIKNTAWMHFIANNKFNKDIVKSVYITDPFTELEEIIFEGEKVLANIGNRGDFIRLNYILDGEIKYKKDFFLQRVEDYDTGKSYYRRFPELGEGDKFMDAINIHNQDLSGFIGDNSIDLSINEEPAPIIITEEEQTSSPIDNNAKFTYIEFVDLENAPTNDVQTPPMIDSPISFPSHSVEKIIAGAQTGPDMAGLDVGLALGYKTGGTAAAKFKQSIASKKSIYSPELKDKYGLKEGISTPRQGKFGMYEDDYYQRTIDNAQEADGTVWFGTTTSPGFNLTYSDKAQKGKPPMLVNPTAYELKKWLIEHNIKTLNVAGNREWTNPGIYQKAYDVLFEALNQKPIIVEKQSKSDNSELSYIESFVKKYRGTRINIRTSNGRTYGTVSGQIAIGQKTNTPYVEIIFDSGRKGNYSLNELFINDRSIITSDTNNEIKASSQNVSKIGGADIYIKEKYFSEGNTTNAKDILLKISKSSHPLNKLAEQLINYVKDTQISLSDYPIRNYEWASGTYDPNKDLITIYKRANFRGLGSEPTIIHEIIHAITNDVLREGTEASQYFKELYDYALTQDILKDEYAMSDLDEFIAGVMTDGKFIKKLQSIPALNKVTFKNLFEDIINHILSLFNVSKNNSLYEEAFAVASNIINKEYIDNLKKDKEDAYKVWYDYLEANPQEIPFDDSDIISETSEVPKC
jgi:hypothetical protein